MHRDRFAHNYTLHEFENNVLKPGVFLKNILKIVQVIDLTEHFAHVFYTDASFITERSCRVF